MNVNAFVFSGRIAYFLYVLVVSASTSPLYTKERLLIFSGYPLGYYRHKVRHQFIKQYEPQRELLGQYSDGEFFCLSQVRVVALQSFAVGSRDDCRAKARRASNS